MKKFFSNPIVALILTVIVVFGSVVINTRTRLGKQCDTISGSFYSVSSSGEISVADSLRKLCNAAEQLVLLGVKYEINDAEDAVESVDAIREALRSQSRDTASLYDEYQELLKDTFALESALARTEMSEADSSSYSVAQHDASEAKAAIDTSSYNDNVRSFLKRNGQFPTPQIAKMSGVSLPVLFA